MSATIKLVRSPLAAYDELLQKDNALSLVGRMVALGKAPLLALFVLGMEQQMNRSQLYILVALTPFLVLVFDWCLQALLLILAVRLAGGRMSFRAGLVIYGYAQATYIFALPALLLPFSVLYFLIFFLNILNIFLLYVGIFRGSGLSRGRSFLVLFATTFLIPLAAVLAFLLYA